MKLNYLKTLCGNILITQLSRWLPKRLKRILFLSSLFAVIQQINEPSSALCVKLNRLFKMAGHPDSILLPMYIKSFIWSNISYKSEIILPDSVITVADLKEKILADRESIIVAWYFNNLAPTWLAYGSLKLMINDICSLLEHSKRELLA